MIRTMIMRTQEGKILHLECHDKLSSTHELARMYAKANFVDGYVVFSENQTKYSSLGTPLKEGNAEHGVYMSCILRPSIFPSQAGFLRAMSAVALIEALEEHTTKRLGIGYVSDIFCEGRRIGRTFTESKFDTLGTFEYIIMTFEVKLPEADFPPRLKDLIKKVFESENTSIPLIIAKNILSKFFSLYPKRVKTPEKFMDIYKRKFILNGVRARYISGTRKKKCKVLGVESNDSRLIIEVGKEIKYVSGTRNLILPSRIKLKRDKSK